MTTNKSPPRRARVLTRLRINEVSAVDRGAGENCKIVLAKRADADYSNVEPSHEERVNADIIGRGALRAQERREQQEREDGDVVRNTYKDIFLGKITAAEALGIEVDKSDDEADELADGDGDSCPECGRGDDGNDHHASQAADLLVESGKHPNRASALDHLLHTAQGAAMLRRLRKHEDQPTMTTPDLQAIAKREGVHVIAKV